MPDFDPSKIAIVLIFLVILVAIQVVVKRSKFSKFKFDKSNYPAIRLLIPLWYQNLLRPQFWSALVPPF